MKIDGLIPWVPEDAQCLVHMLLRRRIERCVHVNGQETHAIFLGFFLLPSVQERKKLQFQNVLDLQRPEIIEVRIRSRLGSLIDAVIDFRETNNRGAGEGMLTAWIVNRGLGRSMGERKTARCKQNQ